MTVPVLDTLTWQNGNLHLQKSLVHLELQVVPRIGTIKAQLRNSLQWQDGRGNIVNYLERPNNSTIV